MRRINPERKVKHMPHQSVANNPKARFRLHRHHYHRRHHHRPLHHDSYHRPTEVANHRLHCHHPTEAWPDPTLQAWAEPLPPRGEPSSPPAPLQRRNEPQTRPVPAQPFVRTEPLSAPGEAQSSPEARSSNTAVDGLSHDLILAADTDESLASGLYDDLLPGGRHQARPAQLSMRLPVPSPERGEACASPAAASVSITQGYALFHRVGGTSVPSHPSGSGGTLDTTGITAARIIPPSSSLRPQHPSRLSPWPRSPP